MVDRSGNLPFWGKVKPLRKYIDGHSLYFTESNGKLFCLVTKTTKKDKSPLYEFEVKTKEQLDKILLVKSFSEIQSLELKT